MLEIKIMIGIYYCHLSCLVPRWSPPEILLFERVLIMVKLVIVLFFTPIDKFYWTFIVIDVRSIIRDISERYELIVNYLNTNLLVSPDGII